MTGSLSNPNDPSFINFSNWLVSETDVEEDEFLTGKEVEIEEEHWFGRSSSSSLNGGLQFLVLKSTIKNDLELHFDYERTPGFFSSFYVEQGAPGLTFLDTPLTRYSPKLGVMYTPDNHTHMGKYEGGTVINVLDLKAPVALIENTLEGPSSERVRAILAEKHDQQPIEQFRVNGEMQRLIKSAVYSDLQGSLRAMQLEGIAIQLLAQQLHAISETSVALIGDTRLTIREEQKIKDARNLMLSDLRTPPSLSEMAKFAALSEKKLTLGFKILFGMTPFELLRQERLESARQALNEDVPLKQIAHRVGYQHVTNFIKAFTNNFGVPPRQHDKLK